MSNIIPALTSLDDAVILLRAEIVKLTKLNEAFVINVLSAYGADLSKLLDTAQQSIKHPDSDPEEKTSDDMVLFEVISDDESNNNMMYQGDIYAAYKMHLIIYGDESEEIAVNLKSNLLMIDEKVKLHFSGVQITSISNITSVNEFKNEVMWQRRDMDISFAFRR